MLRALTILVLARLHSPDQRHGPATLRYAAQFSDNPLNATTGNHVTRSRFSPLLFHCSLTATENRQYGWLF